MINFLLECDSIQHSTNQSLPAAIAITAYSRMFMFETIYKMIDQGATIYYMDTDSIVIDKPIPEELIGNDIGQFKLEHKIKEGYFIAPKLYAFKTLDNEEIVKAKTIGSNLKFNDFKVLIKNITVTKSQERWYKNILGSINIKI
jgi:DNA polymerase elongation subunit (family B)